MTVANQRPRDRIYLDASAICNACIGEMKRKRFKGVSESCTTLITFITLRQWSQKGSKRCARRQGEADIERFGIPCVRVRMRVCAMSSTRSWMSNLYRFFLNSNCKHTEVERSVHSLYKTIRHHSLTHPAQHAQIKRPVTQVSDTYSC